MEIRDIERCELFPFVELTDEEKKDFDYIKEEEYCDFRFFRYRDVVYDTHEFTTTVPGPWNHGLPEEFRKWDGYQSDSFFSGVVICYDKEEEAVVAGLYLS